MVTLVPGWSLWVDPGEAPGNVWMGDFCCNSADWPSARVLRGTRSAGGANVLFHYLSRAGGSAVYSVTVEAVSARNEDLDVQVKESNAHHSP